MIVSRRLNKWKRSRDFIPHLYSMYDILFQKCMTKSSDVAKCPGCSKAFHGKDDRLEYKILKYTGEKIRTAICADCYKDKNPTKTKNWMPRKSLHAMHVLLHVNLEVTVLLMINPIRVHTATQYTISLNQVKFEHFSTTQHNVINVPCIKLGGGIICFYSTCFNV